MRAILIILVMLFASQAAVCQTDSAVTKPEKLLYVAPIQIICGTAAFSAVWLGVFSRRDILDTLSGQADIGAGMAGLFSVLTTALLVQGLGDVILDSNFTYFGLTFLGAFTGSVGGLASWKILPASAGDWRVINRAMPAVVSATVAYALQALFLADSPVRLSPLLGRYSGLSVNVKL